MRKEGICLVILKRFELTQYINRWAGSTEQWIIFVFISNTALFVAPVRQDAALWTGKSIFDRYSTILTLVSVKWASLPKTASRPIAGRQRLCVISGTDLSLLLNLRLIFL